MTLFNNIKSKNSKQNNSPHKIKPKTYNSSASFQTQYFLNSNIINSSKSSDSQIKKINNNANSDSSKAKKDKEVSHMKSNKQSNQSVKNKNSYEDYLSNKNLPKENKCMRNSFNSKEIPPKSINKLKRKPFFIKIFKKNIKVRFLSLF